MTEKEKMLAGMLYDPSDAELTQLLIKARKLARRYNQTDEDEPEQRMAILRELLPNTPHLPALQAPVYFDYGCNTYFGKFSGTNFNFTCLDVCPVHIGDNVMIGPNVTLATPMHPLLPEERNVRQREDGKYSNLEYAKPITIENNCWLETNMSLCVLKYYSRGRSPCITKSDKVMPIRTFSDIQPASCRTAVERRQRTGWRCCIPPIGLPPTR